MRKVCGLCILKDHARKDSDAQDKITNYLCLQKLCNSVLEGHTINNYRHYFITKHSSISSLFKYVS